MKIVKLLEAFRTDVVKRQSSIPYSDKSIVAAHRKTIKKKDNNPNAGTFGRVHGDVNDPHMMHKLNHTFTTLKDDSYFNYVDYVIENNLAQENPYFPRIYKMSKTLDNTEQGRYKIKIEKLTELTKINSEQAKAILLTLLPEDQYESTIKYLEVASKKYTAADMYASTISDYVEQSIIYKLYIKDEAFNSMIDTLHIIKNKFRKMNWDLHQGNMMVRLTPHGPQLVITDPFY